MTATVVLAAQESGGTAPVLVRSFLIAVVVVAPFALWQWRRVRSRRTGPAAPAPSDSEDTARAGSAAGPEHASAALEHLVSEIASVAGTLDPGESATFTLPHDVTLSGTPADPAVADALVRDALARSGLDVVAEVDGPGGRLFECRRRGDAGRLGR